MAAKKVTKVAKERTPVKVVKERKVLKRLTGILLNRKMKEGDVLVFKSLSKIYEGKPQKGAKANDKPADLMNAVNLDTGEEGQIIVSAVLKSTLEEQYPDDSYVGLCFQITHLGKRGDGAQQYNTFDIVEVAE